MKLYSLLKNINCRVFGTTALDISGLYHNHTDVKENGLFSGNITFFGLFSEGYLNL